MPLLKNDKLLEQWQKHEKISKGDLNNQHAEAANDHAFFAGDRMAYTATVTDKGQRYSVVFNKVKPYIDAVSGFMIQLRRKPNYLARIPNNQQQEQFSSYLNAISDYARSNANLDHLESRQDKDMLICGYGAIDTNIIYETNPDGDIKAENIDFGDVWWDPQAREANLLDARWVFRRKKYSRDEAEMRWPSVDPDDFETYQGLQGNFVYNPQGGTYNKISIGDAGQDEDLVEVYYYQYWTLETYYRAENPLYKSDNPVLTAQLSQIMQSMINKRIEENDPNEIDDYFSFDPLAKYLVMTPQIKRDLNAAFDAFGIDDIEYQIHKKRVYYTAIITGETVLNKFKSPEQQGFTIKFKTADYDYERNQWFGMVAALKEPAKYANKSLTEMLYVIASNSKGGVIYEESAVEDPVRFEQQWATTKAAVRVADGAVSGGRIQPKAVASLPSGYENIYNASNDSLGEVTGISKEFLGNSQASQVSGLLEAQRINQTVSTLATYFDSIALYQKEHARYMITLIRAIAENSQGRLFKIIGQDGAINYDEISSQKLAEEYDVDIQEAPSTPTQKQQTLETMITMAREVAQLGQNIYPFIVPYFNIKQEDKIKLIEAMTPKGATPEQIAEEQRSNQIIQEAALANIAKEKSAALYNEAKAQKTIVEIDKTESEADNTRANTLKTLSEAEQKDIENAVIQQRGVTGVDLVI